MIERSNDTRRMRLGRGKRCLRTASQEAVTFSCSELISSRTRYEYTTSVGRSVTCRVHVSLIITEYSILRWEMMRYYTSLWGSEDGYASTTNTRRTWWMTRRSSNLAYRKESNRCKTLIWSIMFIDYLIWLEHIQNYISFQVLTRIILRSMAEQQKFTLILRGKGVYAKFLERYDKCTDLWFMFIIGEI